MRGIVAPILLQARRNQSKNRVSCVFHLQTRTKKNRQIEPIDPPCSNAANERTGSEKTHANKDGDMPYDPLTDREVRDIRRRLKQWNDEIVSSQKHVKDVGEVLSFAERIVSDVGREVEGMIKYRIACEERVVRRLHVDRHIWDGTRRLPALKRAKWQAFVKEDERKKELERARRRNDADNSDSGSECSVEL